MLPSYPPGHRLVMIRNPTVPETPYELYEERSKYVPGMRFLVFIQAGDQEWCTQLIKELQIPWASVYID